VGRVLVQRGVDVRAPMVVMGVLSARSTSHQCGLLDSRAIRHDGWQLNTTLASPPGDVRVSGRANMAGWVL
jgi:hypothetical protein